RAAVGGEAGESGEQYCTLEVLDLGDDHPRAGERAAADVGERGDLDQAAGFDLLDDLAVCERLEGVHDRQSPGLHLLVLTSGQVAEVLAADGVERPEDDD